MLVLVAVFLTFITTPFTLLIYPEKHRVRGNGVPRPIFGKDKERRATGVQAGVTGPGGRELTERFLVVLQKVEHLSAVMFISQLLEPVTTKSRSPPVAQEKALARAAANTVRGAGEGDISDNSLSSSPSAHSAALPTDEAQGGIKMDALKLIELTGRTFSVMQSAEKDQMLQSDDTLQLFKQYGRLRGFEVAPHLEIVGTESYPNAISDMAQQLGSELVLLPWTIPDTGRPDALLGPGPNSTSAAIPSSVASSPVNSIFGPDVHSSGSPLYTEFIRRAISEVSADVALFVDRGFGGSASLVPGAGQHIFLPFFGGADDRLALRLVVQLCANEHVSATVVRVERDGVDQKEAQGSDSDIKAEAEPVSLT